MRLAAASSAALVLLGCLGSPTPLAPNLAGSVGVPHHGVQTGARELPVKGRGFSRYRPKSPNYWGNPRLVGMLERAAARVADELPGGHPLLVGDLSARYGGKIPGHRSHRTGRDIDLLWYVTTPSGAPVPCPGFVPVGTDGIAKIHGRATDDFVALDVERQWLLVKALLTDPEATVQWIFSSRSVEALLIDYARARGEPDRLVWYAETVLLQPGDSTPHDDHFHVRIACAPDEAVNGCEGGGPQWEWLPELPALGPLEAELLDTIVDDEDGGLGPLVEGPG